MTQNLETAAQPAKNRWYHNVWFVLFMLFFVAGPFGLPLVWKNPRLSPLVKMLLTLAVIVFTVWVVMASLELARQVINHMTQFNSTLPTY